MRHDGSARLARAFDGLVRRRAAAPSPFDLGVIQGDGSLLCHGFSVAIPAGDYLVDERFTALPADPWIMTGDQANAPVLGSPPASIASHYHPERRPLPFKPLEAGDRVIVIWIDHTQASAIPYVFGRVNA